MPARRPADGSGRSLESRWRKRALENAIRYPALARGRPSGWEIRLKIDSVHYELTDLCNAGCPQCARTDPGTGKPHDWLVRSACSLERFRRLSPPSFVAGLKSAYFCGNFGDPAVVPDLIGIVRYCYEANPRLWLALHTNASLRSIDWWRALARATSGHPFRVIAGIDGVSQDTNSLYRI
jgi:hypothetical protein